MLSVTDHQGDEDQIHSGATPHPLLWLRKPEKQVLGGCAEIGTLGTLVGVESGAATWKTVWAPQKVQHRTATRSCFSTSGYSARELKTNGSLYQNVPAVRVTTARGGSDPCASTDDGQAKRTFRQGHTVRSLRNKWRSGTRSSTDGLEDTAQGKRPVTKDKSCATHSCEVPRVVRLIETK